MLLSITRPFAPRPIGWLLVAALLWGSLLMPLLGGMATASAAEASGGHWLVICTSRGYERIRVDPAALEAGLPVAATQFGGASAGDGVDSAEQLSPDAAPGATAHGSAHTHCSFCLSLSLPDEPATPLGNTAIQQATRPSLHRLPPPGPVAPHSAALAQPVLPTPPPVA